jgi:putative transposase
MMTQKSDPSTAALWARFRFSVVGSLLSAPPASGELKVALGLLAEKTWTHPVSGGEVHFAVATIERWYYTARREKDDPVGVLRRTVRKDCGKVSLTAEQIEQPQPNREEATGTRAAR